MVHAVMLCMLNTNNTTGTTPEMFIALSSWLTTILRCNVMDLR